MTQHFDVRQLSSPKCKWVQWCLPCRLFSHYTDGQHKNEVSSLVPLGTLSLCTSPILFIASLDQDHGAVGCQFDTGGAAVLLWPCSRALSGGDDCGWVPLLASHLFYFSVLIFFEHNYQHNCSWLLFKAKKKRCLSKTQSLWKCISATLENKKKKSNGGWEKSKKVFWTQQIPQKRKCTFLLGWKKL